MIFRSRKRRAAAEQQSGKDPTADTETHDLGTDSDAGTDNDIEATDVGTANDTGDRDTGDRDTGDRDTGDRDTGDNDNDVEAETTASRAGQSERGTTAPDEIADEAGDADEAENTDEAANGDEAANADEAVVVNEADVVSDGDESGDAGGADVAGNAAEADDEADDTELDLSELGAEEELSEAEMQRLDAANWRDLGPYDIGETDMDSSDRSEDEDHVDLGSMVLPVSEDLELQLQVEEESQQLVSAMLVMGDSALEVGAFAAPSSGGLWPEIRPELVASVAENDGSASLVSGPFGVELRRLLPVETPDGEQGYQPSRMWVAEGPRWMLRGIVYGEASLTEDVESPAAEMLELFRQIVVRRGDEPMAPGDLLPIVLPPELANSSDAEMDGEVPDSGE